MKVRHIAKKRAALARQRALCRCLTDDESTGLWPGKRAQQARDRMLVRTGQRTQESMFFIPPEIVRVSTFLHRSHEF
ncbi:hypothetical protein [Paraburkholderia silvatlantica]|uniref:hypothetical protein n=1 Tax=Paraburkholderia silvatlantica TaxID=321895 RepID=UPI0011B8041E|nr:hypothetical protein [Paraburkholderia silvatlantica]